MKRTRRYSKNEKKKITTEKKERDAFAPAPRTKENKAHHLSSQKNEKTTALFPPLKLTDSQTHKQSPTQQTTTRFFQSQGSKPNDENENESNVPDSDSASAPPPVDPLAGAGCACARGGGGVPCFLAWVVSRDGWMYGEARRDWVGGVVLWGEW